MKIINYCISAQKRQLNNYIIGKKVISPTIILKPKILYMKAINSLVLYPSKNEEELYNKNLEKLCLYNENNTKIHILIWERGDEKARKKVIYNKNKLLSGILDKNEISDSDCELLHSFDEIFGPNLTAELINIIGIGKLSIFSLLFCKWYSFA